jgi:hypothetical protein
MSGSPLPRAALIIVWLTILPLSASSPAARGFYWSECTASHNTGKIVLRLWETCTFGDINYFNLADCVTGETPFYWGAEYPKKSRVCYLLLGAINIGGILYGDTLVSEEYEMSPLPPEGYWEYRSIVDPSVPEYEGAVSQQDFITRATDTITVGIPRDSLLRRGHKPLFVELTTRSYAWSYNYAEDFILFDLSIKNIGTGRIEDAYVSFQIWPDVGFKGGTFVPNLDDLGGFVETAPLPGPCGFVDTVNIMWWADNDGDPIDGVFTDRKVVGPEGNIIRSCPDVNGIYIIHPSVVVGREESAKATLSYNWRYVSVSESRDWGPRRRANYRDFGTGGLGWPAGDRNLYYVMRSGEIDYDQAFTATISQFDPIWMYPPPDLADDIADGMAHIRYMLSFGPFDIDPGAILPIVFAYVAGEDFHTDPYNINNLPDDPRRYYKNLDFSDLAKNARWAEWIYDNPGVDTDGDGDSGKYRVCAVESTLVDTAWVYTRVDTTWYKGDGIPDWRAASPPPAPKFWITPLENGLHIRFNGQFSETTEDVFLKMIDFEGYRIYIGRDDRASSFSTVASYDRDNYDKYIWNLNAFPDPRFELQDIPFTLDSLRCLYGFGDDPCRDSLFDPLAYTPSRPYTPHDFPDSFFYFVKHDFNTSEFGVTTPIRKVYPDEPDPRTLPVDSLTLNRYTDEGYLKYYEYEFTITDLLPTVPYWVNVTAFDFGSPKGNLRALETSVTLGAKYAYPLNPYEVKEENKDKVSVYPNPYRIDAGYRLLGFEGRTRDDLPADKVRAVHFVNLPYRCTIKIFSLDGDLIKKIEHDLDPSDPNSSHNQWNLITRNYQAVVSGLYYWTVESPDRETQIGKLAIIM